MKSAVSRPLAVALLCALLFTSVRPARASIPTGTQVVLIFVAVGAVGAAIGVGVYYAARKSPSLTGCVASGPDSLTLRSEADNQTFSLVGDTAAIKSGDRVRVKGKKKKDANGHSLFIVDKLSRDFGACTRSATAP